MSLKDIFDEIEKAFEWKDDSKIMKSMKEISQRCAYRMNMVRSGFDTYLRDKMDNCLCGHVIDMDFLII